ncbi:MAG: carboxypeptidase regulatory-like domain-containing protein, partial [Acidobacteriota bacterium]
TFSVSGRRPMDNIFLLNGVEYTGSSQLSVTPGGVSGELLGIDAVREFNVLSDTYSAEYGKRAGAQVTVVTQSGTNRLHGSVFEFLRNSALDARNTFDQGFVPAFRRNQFGGALGGPIKKDRLFLFGNYEGFQQRLAVTNVSVVPDDQARQGFLPNGVGVYNKVANLNPAMLAYMSFWPVANGPELLVPGTVPGTLVPSGTAKGFYNPRQSIQENFGTLRSDYILSNHDTVSGAYTIDDGNSIIPQSDPLFGSAVGLRSQVASLQETHIFSPSVLNNFTAGFSRAAFAFDTYAFTSFSPSLDFVTGAGPGGIIIGGGTTTTGIAAITAAGPNNAAGVSNARNLFTFADSVQMVKGRHQISFGVWFQRVRDNEDTGSRRIGLANFASLTTFLQGTTSTFQVLPNPTPLSWRSVFGAWYFEDAIKLSSHLTLRAGLRHEFTNGWNEAFGRAANYVTDSNGVLQTNPTVGNSIYSTNNAKKLFGPRIALAWDPFGNGNTAVRAGFGTYYSLIDNVAFLLNSLPPYNGSAQFSGALSSITPIKPGVQPPAACTGGTNVPPGCSVFAPQGIQPDAKTPTVQEWNFTVEQHLSADTVLRVAYVGSFGYHGLLSVDPNTIPAAICGDAAGCTAGGGTPGGTPAPATSQSRVPQGAQYIPVGRRPNPSLGAGFFWYTEGNSRYNALQTDLVRRLSHGFQFRFNYTWAKNLDMNSGLTGAQANNQAQMTMNRNDVRRDWGPSALNVTHQVSISGHYELPFGKGKRWMSGAGSLGNHIVGGWQLNAITTLLSGFPFTPLAGSNRSGDADTRNPDRPNLNPTFTGSVVTGNPNQWYNPAAFLLPPFGTWGNLGRGVYQGPGLATVDLSVFKGIAVTERINLQFRAEAFNLLNHTNYSNPNATVFSSGAVNPSAGLISSTATTSRQIQFGLKLIF